MVEKRAKGYRLGDERDFETRMENTTRNSCQSAATSEIVKRS